MKTERALLVTFVLLLLGACADSTKELLKKKKMVYTPVTLFFSPTEDYLMRTEFIPDFVNYPDDRVKMGVKGNVRSVEYTTLHKMLLMFREDGSFISRSLIFAGSGNDKEGNSYTFQYDDSLRLQRIVDDTQMVSGERYYDAGKKGLDHFDGHTPDGKPLVRTIYRLNNKKVDHIKRYHYDENGICREMSLSAKSPKQSKQAMVCDVKCDEEGIPISIYVQRTRILAHGLTAGERFITPVYDNDGRLLATKELAIPHNMESYKIDSICCENQYKYNEQGDVTEWKYTDICYPSSINNEFLFSFKYVYDNQGNWTEKHIIGDYAYLNAVMNGYYRGKYEIKRLSDDGNGKPLSEIVIHRNIDYYESEI